ncbi:hypothetical protein MRO13_13005 [Vibrio metschnikovii]|uniref:hypothetical protein n=1 Tax=Vibrio metschnikovii TaxID=28172 RepID=UPI00331AE004
MNSYQSPGLTLAKYYYALKQTGGHLDRSIVWEKHLQWCQALSFALSDSAENLAVQGEDE